MPKRLQELPQIVEHLGLLCYGSTSTRKGDSVCRSSEMIIRHSVPTWTLGPRSAHPKFGGGVILAGIPQVEDRLLAIKARWPEVLSSAHTIHEICSEVPERRGYNSPNAVRFHDLVNGIHEGRFPRFAAITGPAFGYDGVEMGCILGPEPLVAYDMHREAIEWSLYLLEQGLGEGIVIWWPAFDSLTANFAGGWERPNFEDGWKILGEFWMNLLRDQPKAVVHLEYKPSVPGARDYINTPALAIAFCMEVNAALGRKAMVINLEFAHALIGGHTVREATTKIIDAGLYTGFAHPNSAELAQVIYGADGEIISGTPGDDADWPVGVGYDDPTQTWTDQREAVYAMLNAPRLDRGYIIMEHDVDPAGRDPLETLAVSINNLDRMVAELAP